MTNAHAHAHAHAHMHTQPDEEEIMRQMVSQYLARLTDHATQYVVRGMLR